ncbi:hypothetical protein MJO28_016610 [Puccinia striiformis f. sp. tritici]|uniref:Zinc-finger domain-containing protein n=2 Tax=Puccinia striiformis TaxID=27350 RepID=A0A2S4VA69_9BASI|nr:hypothetical protein Pst134EB_030850 [Puccinia striiformis f. sp. tritici]KAI7935739.1 hypothetical protein MJO28_016610 [Puccinia striiformis f. sp. tritici]POW06429.1 hypothetical protein PSHT_10362 [Puccinia striiformis]
MRACCSKRQRCESSLTPLESSPANSSADELLRPFISESDEEVQESRGYHKSGRKDGKSNGRKTVNYILNSISSRINRSQTSLTGRSNNQSTQPHRDNKIIEFPAEVGDHLAAEKTLAARSTSKAYPKSPHLPPKFTTVLGTTAPLTQRESNNGTGVKSRVPLPATEPNKNGEYEASTCHQCRIKTTRPKMICDQSLNPDCVVRICKPCLMSRKAYDEFPKLRAPFFEFVPGGRILCMKCRNICPCVTCRRARGNMTDIGNGLNDFYDLTDDARAEALLNKKKQKRQKAKLKKSFRRHQGLPDKQPVVGDKTVGAVHLDTQAKSGQKGANVDELDHLEHHPANCAGRPDRTVPADRSSSLAPGTSYPHHTACGASMARNSSDPDGGPERSRKRKFCAEPFEDLDKDCDGDNKLMGRLIHTNHRLAEAAIEMASMLQKKEKNSASMDPQYARLEQREKEIHVAMLELHLAEARKEADRNNASADAFQRAKMARDFMQQGLSHKEAFEAACMHLGRPNLPST